MLSETNSIDVVIIVNKFKKKSIVSIVIIYVGTVFYETPFVSLLSTRTVNRGSMGGGDDSPSKSIIILRVSNLTIKLRTYKVSYLPIADLTGRVTKRSSSFRDFQQNLIFLFISSLWDYGISWYYGGRYLLWYNADYVFLARDFILIVLVLRIVNNMKSTVSKNTNTIIYVTNIITTRKTNARI